jgi:hypothetical protein
MLRRTLLVLAAVAFVAVADAPARPVAGSQTFVDTAGDSATAPDITAIAVSNDDAGRITFRFTFANRVQLEADDEVALKLDVDLVHGYDHVLTVVAEGPRLLVWDDDEEDWYAVPRQPRLDLASFENGFSVAISRADLGTVGGFRFYAMSWDHDDDDVMDYAPDGDSGWTYMLRLPFGLTVSPRTHDDLVDQIPHAGADYVVAMRVRRDDTGVTVRTGRITCVARLLGRPKPLAQPHALFLPYVVGTADRTHAACLWTVPRDARGRRLTAAVTLTLNGKQATRTVVRTVR